jgi:RHS repeat-associated protein
MAVTDAKGSIVETYNYTPYGELIDGEYREDIPFLYNGQYGVTTDSNGLYYMRARYYNVEIKRFINQDVLLGELERVSSLNRYAYVEGNPVSYLDPFGLDRVDTTLFHDIALFISFVGILVGVFCEPLGYFISAVASTVDLWTSCFDLGQNVVTGNWKDAVLSALACVLDVVGILSGINARGFAVSKELGLPKDLWIENLDSWRFLGNYSTGGGVCLTIIQKLRDFLGIED